MIEKEHENNTKNMAHLYGKPLVRSNNNIFFCHMDSFQSLFQLLTNAKGGNNSTQTDTARHIHNGVDH